MKVVCSIIIYTSPTRSNLDFFGTEEFYIILYLNYYYTNYVSKNKD